MNRLQKASSWWSELTEKQKQIAHGKASVRYDLCKTDNIFLMRVYTRLHGGAKIIPLTYVQI